MNRLKKELLNRLKKPKKTRLRKEIAEQAKLEAVEAKHWAEKEKKIKDNDKKKKPKMAKLINQSLWKLDRVCPVKTDPLVTSSTTISKT